MIGSLLAVCLTSPGSSLHATYFLAPGHCMYTSVLDMLHYNSSPIRYIYIVIVFTELLIKHYITVVLFVIVGKVGVGDVLRRAWFSTGFRNV